MPPILPPEGSSTAAALPALPGPSPEQTAKPAAGGSGLLIDKAADLPLHLDLSPLQRQGPQLQLGPLDRETAQLRVQHHCCLIEAHHLTDPSHGELLSLQQAQLMGRFLHGNPSSL